MLPPGNIMTSILATSSAASHSRSMAYCFRASGGVVGACMSLAAASRTEATRCAEARVFSGEKVRTEGMFA